MLTPDDLNAMTDDQRAQLLERLGAAYYGSASFHSRLADDMGVSRPTAFRWRREQNTPWAVLFTLDRWVNGEAKAEQVMRDWGDVPAQLSEAAERLAQVSRTLGRIARFSAVARAGSDGGSDPASAPPSEA